MLLRILKRCFGYRPRLLLIVPIVLLLVLLLAACGGSDPTPTAAETSSSSAAAAATDTSGQTNSVDPGDSQTPADVSNVSTIAPPIDQAALIEKLSADDIVAAQEQVLVRIYETLLPSVVRITVSQRLDLGQDAPSLPRIPGLPLPENPQDFFQRGEGSGFVWDKDGHIVTNNHVIDGAERVIVLFADRTEIEARVIGTDPDSDLAVLELEEPKNDAVPVVLGDSDGLKVGQMAVAIGAPFGQDFTMTTGIISALSRTIRSSNSTFSIPQVIQTDAPINPGNSGGPLLDRHGNVIGVNTQIISRSGVSSGIGFSVPVDTAKQVVPALITDGRYEYSWLGITGSTFRSEMAEEMGLPRNTGGAIVIQVSSDSPADLAGLRGSARTFNLDGVDLPSGGDVIVEIEGVAVKTMDDLIAYLVSKTRPGEKITLGILRDGEGKQTLEVSLGKRPRTN